MKHATTRGLYAYWNERRGTRAAPERNDIDPMGLRRELGDIFILAADFIGQPRFRLAGTRVCAAFGREIKGEIFASLFSETSRKSIDDLMAVVDAEAIGAVAGLTGRTAEGLMVNLEMLLLPLAHTGHARIRAIGALVPLVPPYWLGDKPVVALHLTALRHIGADAEIFDAPAFTLAPAQSPEEIADATPEHQSPSIAAPAGQRLRHGFVVYSGGRETPTDEQTG